MNTIRDKFIALPLALLPGMFRTGFRRGLNVAAWKGLTLQSFFGCFLFTVLMLYGVVYTTAVMPVSSTMIGILLLNEWLSVGQAAGMFMVLLSIYTLNTSSCR